MFYYIRKDLQRHLCCDARESDSVIWKLFILIFAYGLHASTVYRFGCFIRRRLRRGGMYPVYVCANTIYLVCRFLIEKMYDIRIDRNAVIEPGLYIGHFGGIRIGSCYIGRNCNLHQQVQIGDHCVLGNNIWLGAHSIIQKGVVIADYATVMVGANVNLNICSGCLASGNPARVINKNYDNKQLLGMRDN